jgi:hypothetical protein
MATTNIRYTVLVTYRYDAKGTEVFGVFKDRDRAEALRDKLTDLNHYEVKVKPIFPDQSARSVVDRLRAWGYALLPTFPARPSARKRAVR